jgi:hypothetical protein
MFVHEPVEFGGKDGPRANREQFYAGVGEFFSPFCPGF